MTLSFTHILVAAGFVALLIVSIGAFKVLKLQLPQKRQCGKNSIVAAQLILILVIPLLWFLGTSTAGSLLGGGESAEGAALLIVILISFVLIPATYLALLIGCVNFCFIHRALSYQIGGLIILCLNLVYIIWLYVSGINKIL